MMEWVSASRPMRGEDECGDKCLVRATADGVLAAVVDGAGHGHEAAAAADLAIRTIGCRRDSTPMEIAKYCHDALRGSRGAVMSILALSNSSRMTWIGVGNVQGRLIREDGQQHVGLLVRAGLVGKGELPKFRPTPLFVNPDDLLLLVTDGIQGDFECQISPKLDPGQIAGKILAQNGNPDDDALVFVARIRG